MADITEINKRLCEKFGLCWHEPDESVAGTFMPDSGFSVLTCVKCKGFYADKIGNSIHQPNPDLRDHVDVKCGDCGGYGKQLKGGGDGFSGTSVPCPTCHGISSRRITKLQQLAEDAGMWEEFLYVHLNPINPLITCYDDEVIKFVADITNTNALLVMYDQWKGE